MKKIKICLLSLLILCGFQICSNHLIYASDFAQMDRWLVMLLNDETDPFFSTSVRGEFLRLGVRKIATICRTAEFKRSFQVVPSSATDNPGQILITEDSSIIANFRNLINYIAVWDKNSSYALPQIGWSDVARKNIYTDSEMRYWYVGRMAVLYPLPFIYPAPADTDTVIVFGCGISEVGGGNEPTYMNPAYDHLVVLYGLYLCYLRHGEREIATYIKHIFNSLLQDIYVITEGRRVDVTIKEKVIPQ